MKLTLIVEREDDGRWIAEVPELPGTMVYGDSQADAVTKAEVLALRVLAERIEHAEAGTMAQTPNRPLRLRLDKSVTRLATASRQ